MTSYFVAHTVRLTKAISPDSSKPDQLFLTGNIEKTIPKILFNRIIIIPIIIHSAVFLQIWGNLRLERNMLEPPRLFRNFPRIGCTSGWKTTFAGDKDRWKRSRSFR